LCCGDGFRNDRRDDCDFAFHQFELSSEYENVGHSILHIDRRDVRAGGDFRSVCRACVKGTRVEGHSIHSGISSRFRIGADCDDSSV